MLDVAYGVNNEIPPKDITGGMILLIYGITIYNKHLELYILEVISFLSLFLLVHIIHLILMLLIGTIM